MTSNLTAPGATAMLQLLSRLRRKGAYLERRSRANGETWQLCGPGQRRGGPAQAIDVSGRLVGYALEQGWLADDGAVGRLRLTELGMLKLSRGWSFAPPPAATVAPRPAPATRPASPKSEASTTIARLKRYRDGLGRTLLSAPAAEAAERLASDFIKGQMMPRVTANWDKAMLGQRPQGMAPGFGIEMRDQIADAQMRVRRALDDAGGDLAGVLLDVCCFDRGLEDVEAARAWPRGSGRVILGIALERLARHYGIVTSGPSHGKIDRWGTGDDKPTLDAWRPDGTQRAPREAHR